MSTAVDELNEQFLQSIEVLPSEFDLEALSSRSFLYSFCGREDYPPGPTLIPFDAELFPGSDFLTWATGNPFASLPGMGAPTVSKKRKVYLDEAELDIRTRARTSSGSEAGVLPSFNCLSNLDLRAQRAFREYRISRGYDNSKTRRNRSLTASSIADGEPFLAV